jgi:hypothetical protein
MDWRLDLNVLEAATYSAVDCLEPKKGTRNGGWSHAVDGVTVTVLWLSRGRGHCFLVQHIG